MTQPCSRAPQLQPSDQSSLHPHRAPSLLRSFQRRLLPGGTLGRRKPGGQAGIVMLLALIALLLISAVGAAILFMAAGESSLVGSQRVSASAFYAALSGLEEVRGRMIRGMPAPDSPTPGVGLNVDPGIGGTVLVPQAANQVLYIVNPGPGEPINPTGPGDPYYDSQVMSEIPAPNFLPTVPSVDPGTGTLAVLPYKWVRVTMKTEFSSRQDINFDGNYDQGSPVFYYRMRQYGLGDLQATVPDAVVPPWGPAAPPGYQCLATVSGAAITCAVPVYKLTTLAALPNGTRRMTQYEVVTAPPIGVNTSLFTQGPLTIGGAASLTMSGDDNCDPDCNPATNPAYPLNCNQLPGARTGGNVTINGNAGTGCPNPNRLTGDCCVNNPVTDPNYDPNCVCQGGTCYPLGQNEAFPYNIQDLLNQLVPLSRPASEVVRQYGGTLTFDGVDWSGQNVKLGTLPMPWMPPPGTTPMGNIPEITYFDATTHLTAAGSSGSGILIVNGDLELNGGFSFYGLVIVTGAVRMAGGGAAGKNIVGSIIAGGGVQASSVGGSVDLNFDSCAVSNRFRDQPLMVLGFREVM